MLEVPESRVFEMRTDGGQLIIRQSVQTRSRESNADVESRYEVRYFIAPYQPGDFAGQGTERGGFPLYEIFRDSGPVGTRHGPGVFAH